MGNSYSEPIDKIKIQFDKMLNDNTMDNNKIDDALIEILSAAVELLKMKKNKYSLDTSLSDDDRDYNPNDESDDESDDESVDESDDESDSMPPLISDSEDGGSDSEDDGSDYELENSTSQSSMLDENNQEYDETKVADYTVFKKGNLYKCTCKDYMYRVKNPVIKEEGCKHIKNLESE